MLHVTWSGTAGMRESMAGLLRNGLVVLRKVLALVLMSTAKKRSVGRWSVKFIAWRALGDVHF